MIGDNGVGMEKEQSSSLLLETARKEASRHIGLKNIHQRIRLYYGKDYGLTLRSEPNRGTTVIIHLPYREDILCSDV